MTEAASTERSGGFQKIAIATLVAGVGGYAITTVVARYLGGDYRTFAAFWAVLYLIVGALSGIQQEITRATHVRVGSSRSGEAKLLPLVLGLCLVVAVASLASAFLWAPPIFGDQAVAFSIPIGVGAALYVGVAAVTGTMYGIKLWGPLSMMIALDVCVRLTLVVLALFFGWGIVALSWMVVVPFPIVLFLAWLTSRGRLIGFSVLDSSYREIAINILKTVAAAASTAALVSGFPAFLGAAPGLASAESLSALIFALTITRAPLVVSTLALQSFLVVYFRDRPQAWVASLVKIGVIVCVGGSVFAVAAWLWGSQVIEIIVGASFALPGLTLGLLVLSSIPTAILALSGSAVLARSSHNYFSVGWIVSAIVAIAIVFSPLDLLPRTLLALTIGPIAGFVVHLAGLLRSDRSHPSIGV